MSFYLRKSLSVGPLRFNLSKSGIGLSAGIKGLRFGTGPRGNYVHMGRYGMYYRASLPGSPRAAAGDNRSQIPSRLTPYLPAGGIEQLTEIDSTSVLLMGDASSADLLRELNTKRKKVRLWPIALTVSILTVIVTRLADAPYWVTAVVAALGILSIVAGAIYDQMTKTVVLFYDLDDEVGKKYQRLHDAFDSLSHCGGKWHVEAKGATLDWKRNAGATSLLRRKAISFNKVQAPYVKTNISVPAIPAGRQTLYFFPDRLLVFDSRGVGAVGYDSLKLEIDVSKFIEDESVPSDCKIVGSTWRFVNKSGGPDRRFNSNREIPIVMYEYVQFRSQSGLNELISFSRTGVTENFRQTIAELADAANRKSVPQRKLYVSSPAAETKVVDLTLPRVTIGREADNIIQLDEESVSGHHALLSVTETGCKVSDLESTNGTFVNGKRVIEAEVQTSDTIEIGPFRIRYE